MNIAILYTFTLCVVPSKTFEIPVREDPAVTNFRTYLRIKTAQPNPDDGYAQAIMWFKRQAAEIGLDFHYLDLKAPNKFALWMTWNGTNPSLKSILLNSHMDVVAADPSRWIYPPFEAYKDSKGNIYARGASDMKSTTIAELEAIRRLKTSGFKPLRTIHMTIMPDEELQGKRGMGPFVKTSEFKNLNVGIDFDEGPSTNTENIQEIIYAEKNVWQFNVTATGEINHAALMPDFTAGQRLQQVIDELFSYRQSELNRLKNPNVTIEDISTLNLVQLGGGIGPNIIPNALWAAFDMRVRLSSNWTFTDAENMLLNITRKAQLGTSPNQVKLEFITKSLEVGQTVINASNIWWTEVQKYCMELNMTCEPHVLLQSTDGRYIRANGIPVFGFSPFPNTTPTAHQDNEVMNEVNFLRGIDRYEVLLRKVSMVPERLHP